MPVIGPFGFFGLSLWQLDGERFGTGWSPSPSFGVGYQTKGWDIVGTYSYVRGVLEPDTTTGSQPDSTRGPSGRSAFSSSTQSNGTSAQGDRDIAAHLLTAGVRYGVTLSNSVSGYIGVQLGGYFGSDVFDESHLAVIPDIGINIRVRRFLYVSVGAAAVFSNARLAYQGEPELGTAYSIGVGLRLYPLAAKSQR